MCYAGVATAWWNIGSSFSGKMDSCCLWICWSFGKSKNKSRLAKSTMISLLLGFLFVHHLWHSTYDRYAFTYLHFTMGQKSLKSPGQKTCLISWFLKYFLWFVCYLLFTGGSHKYSLDPEEYIFAALNIYLDVIMLFKYLVCILAAGGGGGDD